MFPNRVPQMPLLSGFLGVTIPVAKEHGLASAGGRALQREALELAVSVAVRHSDTRYDELLMAGVDRSQARAQVWEVITLGAPLARHVAAG